MSNTLTHTVLVFILTFFTLNIQADTSNLSERSASKPTLDLDHAKAAISNIDIPFEPRYTPVVESYLKTYFLLGRKKAERIIGKSLLYFPLFEKVLAENGMPESLKYLAITESALDPKAISRVGAGGLWQFMPETGKYYGLNISSKVDDRFDPEKATRAAVEYLKKYHAKYGDWALAIASYNSGPGRVSRAIKRSRSKNFWKLKKYLPRETRSYVPGFIAAAYLMKYYNEQGVIPQYPELDMQLTKSTTVTSYLSFYTIARITGISLDVIRALNPAYKKDEIPESTLGYKLVLPARVMPAVDEYLDIASDSNFDKKILEDLPVYVSKTANDEENYYVSSYTAAEGDNLYALAQAFNCSAYNLMAWNDLHSPYLSAGQEIKLYQYVRPVRFLANRQPIRVEKIPIRKSTELKVNLRDKFPFKEESATWFLYQIKRGESLLDIVDRFPGNTLKNLMTMNNLSFKNPPAVGMKIKVLK